MRKGNLVFAILLAISFVSVSTLITFFRFGKIVSSLDWALLIFSFLFLIIALVGILGEKIVGFYATSIYLLFFLVMIILLRNYIVLIIGFLLFLAGLGVSVWLQKKEKDEVAGAEGDKEGEQE